jgi:hypothetical protein
MNSRSLKLGALSGVLGGVVFGMMMGMMGMLPMIGQMVGVPTAAAGFLIHIVNSALIGAGFGVVFGRTANGIASGLSTGLLYGGAWWLLGPLQAMLPSLMGHLLYGAILGASYHLLGQRGAGYAEATAA